MKKKTVYWAPWYILQDMYNWNILFLEPKRLLNNVIDETKDLKCERVKNMWKCPAFNNLGKNTFYVENPLATEFDVVDNPEKGKELVHRGQHKYLCQLSKNGNTFIYGLNYIFFCEDDLEIMLTSPHFSKNVNHTKYARLVPGRFNISKWFRPISLEMLFDDNQTHFRMEEYEHMAYFHFLTDDVVELKRFDLNDNLRKISETCSDVSTWWSSVPLVNRYERFLKTKTNKLVITEIKKQLVD
tara:strand:- start:332 stop:1057 length:726 start_codon:yes stop_codon:yes gene_type:complete